MDLKKQVDEWEQYIERLKAHTTTAAPVTTNSRKPLTYADLLEIKERLDRLMPPVRPNPDNVQVYECKDVPGLYRLGFKAMVCDFCPACDMRKRGHKGLLMIPHHAYCYNK
jgi:hypothetical protein